MAIGLIASVLGIALGLVIDWFPTQASEQAEQIDTLWDVLIICSVPIFVLVIVGRPLLRLALPHAAGRGGARRPADPRQHAAGDHLDRDPGDHPRRALLLRLRRPDRHRGGGGRRARGPRRRRAVHVDVLLPRTRAARSSARRSSTCRAAAGQLHRPVARRDPRLLGPGLPDEDRRGARHRHARCGSRRRRIGEYPVVCAELCGLGHAVMRQTAHVVEPAEFDAVAAGARGRRRRRAAEGGGETRRRGARRPTARRSSPTSGCGGCHALADAGTTGGTGPDLDEGLADKDAAFIEQSIVDPDAEIAQGFAAGLMPPNYGDQLHAGGARRAGEVPCRGDGMMEESR